MIAGNIENRTRTLPMAIYSEVAAGNMDTAKGLCNNGINNIFHYNGFNELFYF
jgi:ABC-type molybdate transport system permease subunit